MSCDQFWRSRLRAAVMARLVGVTAAGDRVFAERNLPWNIFEPDDTAEYPALAIYTGNGRFRSERGTQWTGTADIVVEAWVSGADEAAIIAALEALQDDIYGRILTTSFERYEVTEVDDAEPAVVASAVTVGCARMTFTVEFGLCFEAPDDLTPFTTANFDLDPPTIAMAVALEQPPET